MTPTEYHACLRAIGWSCNQIAEALGCSRTLTHYWGAGRSAIPPAVGDWLLALALAHRTLPPPTDWRIRVHE